MAAIGEKSIIPSRKIGRRKGARIGSETETINRTQLWLGSGLIQESRIRAKIIIEMMSKRILTKESKKLVIYFSLLRMGAEDKGR